MQLLLSPYLAAGLPAAGAAAIAIYAKYGYELKWLYNSFFSKFIFKITEVKPFQCFVDIYGIKKISKAILFFFQNRVRTWIAKIPRIPVVMEHAIVAPHRVLYVMLARNFPYAQMAYAFAAR